MVSTKNPAGGLRAWKTVVIDSAGGGADFGNIACTQKRLCVAAGDGAETADIATSTNPTGGARAWKIARIHSFTLNFAFSTTSCPSARLCVITDPLGHVVSSTRPTRGARAWKVVRVLAVAGPVSCPSIHLCLAAGVTADQSDIVTSHDPTGGAHAWTVGVLADQPDGVVKLSCGSTRSCVAVDDHNDVLSTTSPAAGAGAWTLGNLGQGSSPIASIDCPAAEVCVGGDGEGVISSTNPSGAADAWNRSPLPTRGVPGIYGPLGLASVSCPTTTFCVGVDGTAVLTSADPTGGASTWAAAPFPIAQVDQVSCSSPQLCVATTESGEVLTSTDPGGGEAAWTGTPLGIPQTCDVDGCYYTPLIAISCPTDQFCAVTDGTHVWVSVNPTGGSADWVKSELPTQATALACPSAGTCVIASNAAMFTTTNAADASPAWTAQQLPAVFGGNPPAIDGLSCPTDQLCVAVDGIGGDAFTGDPSTGTWTVQHIDENLNYLDAVSCAPSQTCVAADQTGDVIVGQSTQ